MAGSVGNEVGVIFDLNDKFNTSVPLWSLDVDSRLLHVGDVGNAGASRPSERKEIDMKNYLQFNNWLSFVFDLALTNASLSGIDLVGNDIQREVTVLHLAD